MYNPVRDPKKIIRVLQFAFTVIVLAFTLSACSQKSDQEKLSIFGDKLSASLPKALLSIDQNSLVVEVIDGETTIPCTGLSVDQGNGTFSCAITLSGGSHTLSLVYSVKDATYGTVPVATTSDIVVDVIVGQTAQANFGTATLTYDDDDNDSYSNIFELENGSDPTTNEPPIVTATTPLSGAIDQGVSTSITVTFSDPMDSDTLNANFTLVGSTEGSVNGTVTYDDASQTATFVPTAGVLKYKETYTASLSTAVQDAAGAALAAAESWTFTIQESPVLQVSDIRTAGTYSTPIIVYNDAGDGVAVWEVSSAGRSLVYSLYDRATDSWSADTVLASMSYTVSMFPKMVTNGTGFGILWLQYTGSTYELYASVYNGSNWSTPQVIDSQETSVSNHKLASNGMGYAASWQQGVSNNSHIYASISTDGTSWGSAVVIDNSLTASFPQLTSNGSGYAVIWRQDSPLRLGVNIYTGRTWGSAELLDDSSLTSVSSYDIASNGSGFSVIWTKDDGTDIDLWSRTYYDSGSGYSWSTRAEIDNGANNVGKGASIISNGTGYTVAYIQYDGTYTNLYARNNALGDASWGSNTLLENLDTSIFYGPQLATDGATYAVAWTQYDGSSQSLYASVFNGTSWSSANSPIETGSSSVSSFNLAGYNTQYIVTWHQQIGGINSIFANVYTSGSGWGIVEPLEAGTGAAINPNISVSPLDGFTVVWNQIDASGLNSASYTNTFNGTTWRGEQPLAAATYGGSSYMPEMLSNGNGKVLAFWKQDRSGTRVLYVNIYQNGAWGIPELLPDTGDIVGMQAATDGNGFVLIWSAYDGTFYSIYARVYDGIGWSAIEEVDDSNLSGSASFTYTVREKAIVSNGNSYMLVYTQYDDGAGQNYVYARQYKSSAWESSATILDDPSLSDSAIAPQIATNGTTYLATWSQSDGSYSSLYASEFNGTAWGSAQLVEHADNFVANICVVSDGVKYLAVWVQQDTIDYLYRVWGNFYVSGSWETPVGLDDKAGHVQDRPHVIAGDGGFAVAWQVWADTNTTIKVNTYDGTTWTGVTTLDDGTSGGASLNPYSSSNLIRAAGNNFAVLWGRYNGTTYNHNLFASVFDGTDWSPTKAFDSGSGVGSDDYLIASDGDGYLTAWRQNNGNGIFDIVSSRWTAGVWELEKILDESSSSAFDLNLTGDNNGYYATWTQPEPGGDEAVRFPWAKVLF